MSAPKAPRGLGAAGKRLFKAVIADLPDGLEFADSELEVLAMAARQADTVADLEAVVATDGVMSTGSTGQATVHPAIAEARQGRGAVARLLASLAVDASVASSAASPAARQAWAQAERERRAG